ncbi:MAG: hypothetical protein HYZ53_04650 [Planctomycetes bacterium]|nr:hypothetical protein [Planctomycetota bacterium]
MGTTSSTSSSSPRPKAFLLALALLGVLEGGLWPSSTAARFLSRYTRVDIADALSAVSAVRAGRRDPARRPCVLLGSSRIREGFDEELLRRALPECDVQNLAVGGSCPADLLYLVRRSASLAPATVVLGVSPDELQGAPKAEFLDAEVAGLLATRATAGTLANARVAEKPLLSVVLVGLAGEWLPTLRHRQRLWRRFSNYKRLAVRQRGLWPNPDPDRTGRFGCTDPAPADYFAKQLAVPADQLLGASEWCAFQEAALERAVDACVGFGDTVLLVDFPSYPGFETRYSPSYRDEYHALLARLGARPRARVVGQADLPALAPSEYADYAHLLAPGRERMSARLAELVREAERQ